MFLHGHDRTMCEVDLSPVSGAPFHDQSSAIQPLAGIIGESPLATGHIAAWSHRRSIASRLAPTPAAAAGPHGWPPRVPVICRT